MCALELSREAKGITANYWRILSTHFDANQNNTVAVIGLYESKRARNLGVNNNIEQVSMTFNGFCSQAEVYAKMKESKMAEREITPAVTTGSLYTNDFVVITPAVTETYESNPFVSALDV